MTPRSPDSEHPRWARPDVAVGACLGDDTIAALAEGRIDAASRAAALPHLAECADCRAAVAAVALALGDVTVRRALPGAERPAFRRWRWGVAAGVAAAALLVFARPGDYVEVPRSGEQHRAPVITNGTTPAPTSPLGLVAAVDELRWSPVTGADRYRVTVFDADGRVLYEVEQVGATMRLPDSLPLRAGARYFWKVDARTGFDRWISSDLVEFAISGRPR